MAIAVDASSPAGVVNNAGGSVATASFTPPALAILVATITGNQAGSTGGIAFTMSNTGPALTWSKLIQEDSSQAGTDNGAAAIYVAQLPNSSTAMTATVTESGGGSSVNTLALKIWVVTGGTLAPAGGTARGASGTNNLTTTGFTALGSSGLVFACGAEWNALGTPTSSDLGGPIYAGNNSTNLSYVHGFHAVGASGSTVTANLDAGGTGTAKWVWATAEIQLSAPTQTVSPSGIASAEAFGTAALSAVITVSPTGIASGEAFGTALVNDGAVRPAGIASAQAFGTATITPGPVTLSPTGIGSAENFGTPKITVTFDLSKLDRRARQATGFELLAVARVPQPSGPPMLLTVDPIAWKGLSWVDELSKPQQLNASVSVNLLTDDVIKRLRKLHELPTELWLYRNGRLVFAGPWLGWSIQGDTLTMSAAGMLAYVKYMYVTSDLVFANTDQFAIVKAMIDHWQNQAYGNFGIVTSNIASSGVTRDATYKKVELHNIAQRIEELGKRENGFDMEVDPTTRELKLWYPKQGTDRSTGEDAVVFDKLTVTSSNVSCSAAPGDVASDAYGTGTGTGDPVYSAYSDTELLAKFGKAGVTESFDGVSEQATLDDHVRAAQLARNAALLIPAPGLRSIPDVDLSAYNVGDTVAYQLHARLGIEGAFRLRKRTVTVSDNGVEQTTLEFV